MSVPPFSLGEKVARVVRRMRALLKSEGALRANPHPNPLP
jgi:hypothetical protein